MRAGGVASAGERGPSRGDPLQRLYCITLPANASWVVLGPDKNEVVGHDAPPIQPVALCHEPVLDSTIMKEKHVSLASGSDREGLPRADCDHVYIDASLGPEQGHDVGEQA
jgi:hypothetical protein